ncbi:hypothetical protein [Alicyclobacillus macrosporangiidus]|uniref:DinB/UmuC family translesion DNA polymerase n=1 Tax=Alicyclobacillus macrosporangiidus TaxID=392015 RepID=UPI001E362737|nr:hypothetical protein [Alicyclobacillus macrosporangiidus]
MVNFSISKVVNFSLDKHRSHGQDVSEINPSSYSAAHKSFSHRTTLPRDFYERSEIAVVILELLDEVCRRVRAANQKGRRVGLSLTYAGFQGGVYRAKTLPDFTDQASDLYPHLLDLLDRWWDKSGVRAVSVSLDMLETGSDAIQLSLFEDRTRRHRLSEVYDEIRTKFGETSIMRAASLLPAGQFLDRSKKIGGHYM